MLGHSSAIVLLILVCSCLGVPVPGQTTEGWKNKKADVCIVVDASSSVWERDFTTMLQFVSSLVSEMDIGPSTTRVGVGVFADRFTLHIPITNNLPKETLRREILNAPYLKGDGYLSRGLHGLREKCLPQSLVRLNVPLIAVVFTDGPSRHKQLSADNATLIKENMISLFTVGATTLVDRNELLSLASDPKKEFNYYVDEFRHLSDIHTKLSTRMSQVQIYQEHGTCGRNVKADTFFVFNEAALGRTDSQNIKIFIGSVVNNFSMNSGNMRASVITKSCLREDIEFGQYITKEDFIAGLQTSDGPDISELLRKVLDKLGDGSVRHDAKKRVVIILQAKGARETDTMRAVSRIKYIGAEIFVIVLGSDYNSGFINSLASNAGNIITPGSTDDLIKTEWIKQFSNIFCSGLTEQYKNYRTNILGLSLGQHPGHKDSKHHK